ncbi:MAG TPA: DUF502 domain-containing protein [Candidatus Polarisedimenticolaceae bacterium]|nr:DUF502 domain-containing protein [Candidatus Polarisedimenticolaceae bacterium]
MTPLRHVRTHLVRGLLIVLPTIITLWLLRILFGIVSDDITPLVVRVLPALGIEDPGGWRTRFAIPLVGVVLTLLLVYLIGLLAANLLGARIVAWLEALILRIPLVKGVYGAARQLLDALGSGGKGAFSRVVLVEYPRPSVWTLGFVTNERRARVPGRDGSIDTLMVFFPTAPNPTSGWLALVPVSDLVDVDLTIEEGVKLIVSGGIVTPDALSERIRRPDPVP